MKIKMLRFSANQLRSIHSDHLGFLLASSHCCNELISVSPYIIFEHDLEKANDAEKAFIQIRFFTIVRLQIAKIFEYRELCNEYLGKLRKTYPAFAEKMRQKTSTISRQINEARWAQIVRNKVAFHFDTSYALECLRAAPSDQELYFFAGEIREITAFDFADRILVNAMFSDAGQGDVSAGRDIVRRWTIELQSLITRFHAETMIELFESAGLWRNMEDAELRDQYCAPVDSICIPLSTVPPSNEQA